jgi:hypothetical protein
VSYLKSKRAKGQHLSLTHKILQVGRKWGAHARTKWTAAKTTSFN